MEAIVEFDYTAQEEDELNLKVGDIITNVTKVSEGWCEGINNGRKGMFPDNFVKIKRKTEEVKDQVQKRSNDPVVAELRNKLVSVIGVSRQQPSGKKIVNKKVKVLYQYAPQNDDELALEIGQVLEVIRQDEPGWWEGNLNGKMGMFPSNFVEVIEGDSKGASNEENVPEIKGRKVMGVGFGPNMFDKGAINLKPTAFGNRLQSDASKAPALEPKPLPKKPVFNSNAEEKPVLRAKVLYSYTGENDDELTISVGDILIVLDQNLEDAGWWKGELNGKIGVFPDNFVELLQEEKKKAVMPPNGVYPKPSAGPTPSVDLNKFHKKEEKVSLPSKNYNDVLKQSEHPERKELSKTDTLNSVQSSELLTHLNANRVHGPPARKPPTINPLPQKPVKEDKKVVPSLAPPKAALQPPTSKKEEISNKPHTNENMSPDNHIVSHLPLSTTASNITREQYTELYKELQSLREQLDSMRQNQERRFKTLMSEIDEEKKTRMSMQVELDRIKKLLPESDA